MVSHLKFFYCKSNYKLKYYNELFIFFKAAYELTKNQIVWSQWKIKGYSIWWPAIVDKLVTPKNLKPRVYVRYYERSQRYGSIFGMDTSKVEPFYSSTDRHSYYKVNI